MYAVKTVSSLQLFSYQINVRQHQSKFFFRQNFYKYRVFFLTFHSLSEPTKSREKQLTLINKMEKEQFERKRAIILFISQIVISTVVLIVSLINITLKAEHPIWFVLLGTSLGFLIPGPTLNKQYTTSTDIKKQTSNDG